MSSTVKSVLSSLKKLLKPDEDIGECLHYDPETPEERAEDELDTSVDHIERWDPMDECDEMCHKCDDYRMRHCDGVAPVPETVHGL